MAKREFTPDEDLWDIVEWAGEQEAWVPLSHAERWAEYVEEVLSERGPEFPTERQLEAMIPLQERFIEGARRLGYGIERVVSITGREYVRVRDLATGRFLARTVLRELPPAVRVLLFGWG